MCMNIIKKGDIVTNGREYNIAKGRRTNQANQNLSHGLKLNYMPTTYNPSHQPLAGRVEETEEEKCSKTSQL